MDRKTEVKILVDKVVDNIHTYYGDIYITDNFPKKLLKKYNLPFPTERDLWRRTINIEALLIQTLIEIYEKETDKGLASLKPYRYYRKSLYKPHNPITGASPFYILTQNQEDSLKEILKGDVYFNSLTDDLGSLPYPKKILDDLKEVVKKKSKEKKYEYTHLKADIANSYLKLIDKVINNIYNFIEDLQKSLHKDEYIINCSLFVLRNGRITSTYSQDLKEIKSKFTLAQNKKLEKIKKDSIKEHINIKDYISFYNLSQRGKNELISEKYTEHKPETNYYAFFH